MGYRVVITKVAQKQFDACLNYLAYHFKSKQTVRNVLNDYQRTIERISISAYSLNIVENKRLRELGYKRINFSKHRYFMLFRIKAGVVYVDQILHELQDYENKIK